MEVVRFFRIIKTDIQPETSFAELPSAFVRTLSKVELNSKKAVLKSYKGSWNVGVKKCSDGLLHFFGERWDGFVSAHELEVKDFIVFEHIGHLQFNSYVFDETCCDKELTTSDHDFMCRFFKVIVPGFETSLKLPPTFVSILNDMELKSKSAVLKSCKGSWKVRVKKCDDGLLRLFGNNWVEYVSAHKLKPNGFIVFEPSLARGSLCFYTIVFDETCCEKNFTAPENAEKDTSGDDDDVTCLEHVGNIDSGPEENENSIFQMTIIRSNLTGYLTIPAEFARSNGMSQNGNVELQNAIGESWLAKLNVLKYDCKKYVLARITGLLAFYKENQLNEEDICIFKLNHASANQNQNHFVMDVTFVRK